ncbi:hypothetical protein TTHERM_00485750 (macronuclear) [Tetrahymena thermophila SB210]|uniref:Uncharacterized protein n=1 Tax=Tetrahymena thermophila (strain SB210) TaxID=312017 RepID=I7MGG0_TETTS|nr:hypothetical protein TTHERM_00485750 [Tetrahymena thermophila SB210]EAR85125.1 hypothetical protein TTHERM_00485750 [Tetrahymena thermophila SB210]|eukprot:XP_001032788.1 hypothetical protein TTHERM_00485750 [Tetrahymena thermophila SB210]
MYHSTTQTFAPLASTVRIIPQSPVILGNQPIESLQQSAMPQQHPYIDNQSGLRENEKLHQIRVQAARIQKLEERISLLLEENQKQESVVNFKQQESVQWQENYNSLRDDFLKKSNQMNQLEEEIDQILKKQSKLVDDIEKNEQDIRNLHNEIYAKNEDIHYWKDRSNQALSAQAKIAELEKQIDILTKENSKLNKLLMQSNDYTQ